MKTGSNTGGKIIKGNSILSIGHVNGTLATIIKQSCQMAFFQTSSTLFYEDHYPLCAYFIVGGSVSLEKKRVTLLTLNSGCLFAFREFVERQQVTLTARIAPKSTLLFLAKDDLERLLSERT